MRVLHTPVTSAPKGLRDLHRERADPARGTVDEHRLAGFHVSLIAQRLEGDEPGQGDRGSLLEGEVCRLQGQRVLVRRGVIGERADAPAEDLVTGLEPRDLAADRLDLSRDVRPADFVLRAAQPVDRSGDVRQPVHDRPVGRIDARRADADQHLVVADAGLVDIPRLDDVARAVPVLHHGLHP